MLAIAVFGVARAAARFGFEWLGWWERPLARLARNRKLAILAAALAPLLIRAVLLLPYPKPEPQVHDEFSFLLTADTFAHGRLVSAQHPFWPHFESIHILSRPAYTSAFPIAQPALLALGKVAFGNPWAGVWLSSGLMCGTMCWMLQGWLPPRWALLGAVLVILRLGISSYWMNSYWGGCVAAAGGALVLGALPRMRRSPRWCESVIMGIGLAVLANSRPVEGAMFGLVVAVVLFAWMFGKQGPPVRLAMSRIVLPLVLLLGLAGIGVGYYFARVTGKPWLAPYVLYRTTMSITPHFLWQKPTPEPLYNSAELRDFYVYWEMATYTQARRSLAVDLGQKTASYWRFYLGPLLTIPLLALPVLWRDRKSRQLLLMAAAFSLVLAGQVWHNAHYAAPATGLAILIVVLAMRRLRLWRWRGLAVGLYLVRSVPMACAAMLLIQIVAGRSGGDSLEQRSWRWPTAGGVARAGVLSSFKRMGGQHLVFVRYNAGHNAGDEWVYNDADIDGSHVVWARELDRGSNAELMRYFPGRQVWLVEPDATVPHAVPYGDAPVRLMRFVRLGAPGIAVLRSAEELRTKLVADGLRTCDVWNFYFSQATGVEGADAAAGCFVRDRGEKVSFEHWFSWMRAQ